MLYQWIFPLILFRFCFLLLQVMLQLFRWNFLYEFHLEEPAWYKLPVYYFQIPSDAMNSDPCHQHPGIHSFVQQQILHFSIEVWHTTDTEITLRIFLQAIECASDKINVQLLEQQADFRYLYHLLIERQRNNCLWNKEAYNC